ncbi:Membrane protein like [Actinidia chinensis var. chinensis]|uniref:Membrane protein like n=1 Tax=Actinidia chinensis var. chinensis TaxID=1590841 RepID=A0A2R6PI66_ACTCC|nr:Membrane protein like [Actinidia chinensis var. chinensis]
MVFTEPFTSTLSLSNTKPMVGLSYLLGEKFFIPCLVHQSEKKSEKNTFCLDCSISLCPHCLPPHENHRLLQIRRYVYQDVIRLSDAQKLMDCSFVQSYTTNSAKVVFLNQRPMTRQFKGGSTNICIVCDRKLQHPYLFCSLSCKVHQMGNAKFSPTKQHLYNPEWKGVRIENCLELERGQTTPDSVLELPISLRTSSGSSSSSVGVLKFARSTLASTAATVSFSRIRHRPVCSPVGIFSNAVSRRKRTPHRSPMY